MKALIVLSVALAVASAHVVELGDASFESELEGMETALVMFYAPWCGHCKKLKPEFDKAADDLLRNNPPVNLVKVDCTEAGKDVCNRFEVRGYPTLKIFRSGELSSDYNGPREANGIVKFMKSQVGPASFEVDGDGHLRAVLDQANDVVVVGKLTDDADMEVFQKVANKMRQDLAFAHYQSGSEIKDAGIFLNRQKHLKNKFEDSEVKYDGKMDKDAIQAWIKENYHGLVGHRTLDHIADFSGDLVVAYYDVDYAKNPKGTNYWRNRVMKVAQGFKNLKFAVSNKNDFMQELTEFGLDQTSQSSDGVVVAIKSKDGKKFTMEDKFSMESFKKFLEDFEAGKLEPYMKSEPLPENNDAGVKIAVGKNYDELVKNSGKDVLIEFYAPWCGHCKKLAPIYDELGEKMVNEEVLIVKMDATANDAPPEFEVRGFPTIFWLKKGEKPEAYNGGREVDDFVKFIAAKATKELNGFDRKGKAKKTEL